MAQRVHKWDDVKGRSSKLLPEEIERIEREALRELDQEIIEGDLRAVREAAGLNQVEAAKLAEMTRGEVSRLENRDDYRLSTLRRFVQALGGRLEVIAHVGDKTVKLRGM